MPFAAACRGVTELESLPPCLGPQAPTHCVEDNGLDAEHQYAAKPTHHPGTGACKMAPCNRAALAGLRATRLQYAQWIRHPIPFPTALRLARCPRLLRSDTAYPGVLVRLHPVVMPQWRWRRINPPRPMRRHESTTVLRYSNRGRTHIAPGHGFGLLTHLPAVECRGCGMPVRHIFWHRTHKPLQAKSRQASTRSRTRSGEGLQGPGP